MKKYISPEIDIVKVEAHDVLNTSNDTFVILNSIFDSTNDTYINVNKLWD